MAESAVSFAAEHIETLILEDSKALHDVESEADTLGKELRDLEEFLDSVRNKEPNSMGQVRSSLLQLGRIANDAEDVVDTFVSETQGKVFRNLIPRGFFKSSRVIEATNKIQMLLKEMKEVKKKLKDEYNHVRGEGSGKTPKKKLREAQVHGALPFKQAHLQADDDFVVGIDGDVDRLVELLVGELDDIKRVHSRSTTSSQPVDVLAIVGMGGSGKTTLARNIYKHHKVEEHFEEHAWVPLSKGWEWDSYNEKALMSELLRQLGGSGTGNRLLGDVASQIISKHDYESDGFFMMTKSRLRTLLNNKKCLIVLDDVWHWESFQKILQNLLIRDQVGSSSSVVSSTKIIITTRQHLQLSENTDSNWVWHYTQLLSDEDGWKLLNEITDRSKLATEHRGLAMEMLGTCKGLPLAIVALGRLLKTKDTIQDWERVFSHLDSEQGSRLYKPVNDILALSYDELPYYLEPCFLYLGLLAEDSTISAGSLKRMWIAEGFVKRQTKSNETPEDTANRLLQELVEHTMVQVVTKTYAGKVKTLRVHDIMRDLCIQKAQELDFLTIFSSDADQGTGTHSSRGAAINFSKCSKPLTADNSHLRSLLLFAQSSAGVGGKNGSRVSRQGKLDLALLCEKFKLLRVLDIIGVKTSDSTMPKEIGNLIHLRYLRVRSTNIRELPRSIGKLRKLLTLDYWDVSVHNNEVIIPDVLSKLERLRHLFLPGDSTSSALEDLKLDTLKDIQTLWGVKGGNWMLKEMKNLSSKLTKLCIQGISSLEQLEAVFNCPVIKTKDQGNLYALALDWYGLYNFTLKSPLETLCSKNLKKLRLMGKAPDKLKPVKFPSSLGKIELHYTQLEEEETMDALGELRNLLFLELAKDSYIGSEWICKENAFPKLEELKLSNLPNLKIWEMNKAGAMQGLKKLLISSCANLQQLPRKVKSISTLETLEIARMPTKFNNRLREVISWDAQSIGGEDSHIVRDIPN